MQRISRHAIFWLVIYFLWAYMKSGNGAYYSKYLLVNLVNVPIYMTAYYLLRHVQLPKLYDKGKIIQFLLSIVAMSLFFFVIWRVCEIYWLDDLRGFRPYPKFFVFGAYLIQTVQFYSPAMLLIAWELYDDRQKENIRIEQLEKEKIANELKFLKAQLNPHFLFNTLNNLYSYVVNKSPKAPNMILHLSGILDYVLYKSQNKSVPLSDEVATIEHFLALEKIRYGERLKVNFEASQNMQTFISPLLFLSVVENAFKHGASGDTESPKIDISIKESLGAIHCEVWNTKSLQIGELNDAYKEGIGLSNIKRQLNLVYPKRYRLVIDDQKDSFKISITINPTT